MPRNPSRRAVADFLRQSERIVKAPAPSSRAIAREVAAVRGEIARDTRQVARAFMASVNDTKDFRTRAAFERALDSGRVEEAIRQLGWNQQGADTIRDAYATSLRRSFETAGQRAAESVGARYNPLDIRVYDTLSRQADDFARQIVDAESAHLHNVINEMLQRGDSPRLVAERIRDHIGLNQRSSIALERYRADLEARGLNRDAVDRMVERRAETMLRMRANLIGQNEMHGAAVAGQTEGFRQAREQGEMNDTDWVFQWVADTDPCELCAPIDGERRRRGELFTAGDGSHVPGPGFHVRCDCWLLPIKIRTREAA